MSNIKVYISLPISGRDINVVRHDAEKMAEMIRMNELIPVSPFDVSPDDNATYAEHMGKDIQALLESDAVVFMKGWQDSKGCQAEYEVARIYGKKILFEPI